MLCLLLVSSGVRAALCQSPSKQKGVYEEMDRFWVAYDRSRTTTNRTKQIDFINCLYIKSDTEALATFSKARTYLAELWLNLIQNRQKYWVSIQPNTLAVKTKIKNIEKIIWQCKRLYPELREASMVVRPRGFISKDGYLLRQDYPIVLKPKRMDSLVV